MITDVRDFRRLRFQAPESFEAQWLEWYRDEFVRAILKIDLEIDPAVPLHLEGAARVLPDLTVYSCGSSSMNWLATKDLVDALLLTVSLEGDIAFRLDGDALRLSPGMAMFGAARPGTALDFRDHGQILGLRLSPRLLAPLVPNVNDLSWAPIRADSQALRLLLAYARMLDAEETIETPEARHLVAMHVHDLAALALGASGDARQVATARGVRAGRLAAIKNDILANLTDPRLSVAAVAGRQGLTPRYVHMLFEGEGVTFTGYVVAERLARACRMLADHRFAARSISAIALSVGFGDLSYFNRCFRRRYGMTPSDMREQGRSRG